MHTRKQKKKNLLKEIWDKLTNHDEEITQLNDDVSRLEYSTPDYSASWTANSSADNNTVITFLNSFRDHIDFSKITKNTILVYNTTNRHTIYRASRWENFRIQSQRGFIMFTSVWYGYMYTITLHMAEDAESNSWNAFEIEWPDDSFAALRGRIISAKTYFKTAGSLDIYY